MKRNLKVSRGGQQPDTSVSVSAVTALINKNNEQLRKELDDCYSMIRALTIMLSDIRDASMLSSSSSTTIRGKVDEFCSAINTAGSSALPFVEAILKDKGYPTTNEETRGAESHYPGIHPMLTLDDVVDRAREHITNRVLPSYDFNDDLWMDDAVEDSSDIMGTEDVDSSQTDQTPRRRRRR